MWSGWQVAAADRETKSKKRERSVRVPELIIAKETVQLVGMHDELMVGTVGKLPLVPLAIRLSGLELQQCLAGIHVHGHGHMIMHIQPLATDALECTCISQPDIDRRA